MLYLDPNISYNPVHVTPYHKNKILEGIILNTKEKG